MTGLRCQKCGTSDAVPLYELRLIEDADGDFVGPTICMLCARSILGAGEAADALGGPEHHPDPAARSCGHRHAGMAIPEESEDGIRGGQGKCPPGPVAMMLITIMGITAVVAILTTLIAIFTR